MLNYCHRIVWEEELRQCENQIVREKEVKVLVGVDRPDTDRTRSIDSCRGQENFYKIIFCMF